MIGAIESIESAIPVELAWQERAACREVDAEAFFPEKGGSNTAAKRTCGICEVRAECLAYALATDQEHGVWGGMTERERRALKRRADRQEAA